MQNLTPSNLLAYLDNKFNMNMQANKPAYSQLECLCRTHKPKIIMNATIEELRRLVMVMLSNPHTFNMLDIIQVSADITLTNDNIAIGQVINNLGKVKDKAVIIIDKDKEVYIDDNKHMDIEELAKLSKLSIEQIIKWQSCNDCLYMYVTGE